MPPLTFLASKQVRYVAAQLADDLLAFAVVTVFIALVAVGTIAVVDILEAIF